jgi:hypothetical protein
MAYDGSMKPTRKIITKVNGAPPSNIHPHNSIRYVCVGCGANDHLIAVIGGERIQKCKRCNYTAMLPGDAPEVEVLRLRVNFLTITSNEIIESLREVIASQATELAQLKGEPDPATVRKANLAAAEIMKETE